MHEKQEIEQYFFDGPTLDHLAAFAARFSHPCCLCTPTLGQELERRGVAATTLDIDDRFSYLPGFRHYNISAPVPLDRGFSIIICDPPFLSVPLSQLLESVRVLSRGNYSQPLLINYLASKGPLITRVFEPFGLAPTGYRPGYAKIRNTGRNEMEFYGNLGPDMPLKPPVPSI